MAKIEKLNRFSQGLVGIVRHDTGNWCEYRVAQAREDALLKALKMHQEHHKRNWDTQETCHICKVTHSVIEQIEAAR